MALEMQAPGKAEQKMEEVPVHGLEESKRL
jgi:hypothetical protein